MTIVSVRAKKKYRTSHFLFIFQMQKRIIRIQGMAFTCDLCGKRNGKRNLTRR